MRRRRQMSAEDYAADQLITSRRIQSSVVADATAASLAHAFCICIVERCSAVCWFNTSLYWLCIERRPTPSSTLRLSTVLHACQCERARNAALASHAIITWTAFRKKESKCILHSVLICLTAAVITVFS